MRYNFVPALNPMAPCKAKGVKHHAAYREPLIFGRIVHGFSYDGRYRRSPKILMMFSINFPCLMIFLCNNDGRDDYWREDRLFRTPTPWHKYQYRPAKKERNLTQAVKKKRIFMGLEGQYPWEVFSIWFYPYENRIERAPFLKGIRCRCYPLVLPESLGRSINPKVGI